MKKIMMIRLSSLGDVIFNLPLANVLKKNGFEVTWLVSEKGIDIVKDNPAVDKAVLIPLQRWKKEGFSIKNLIEFLSILINLRKEHFDIAIDTQMMFKSMIWLKLCGAKRRLCYTWGREFSNHGGNEKVIPDPNPNFSQHAVFQHLRYARYLELEGTDEIKFTLPPASDETKAKIDDLIKDIDKSKPLVIIAPATTRKLKHWNKDNWRKVVDAIKDKCTLVFTGGACDNELISYISQGKFLSLAGKTSIKDLIELFSRATLVMAPDSGSAHLARATNKPAVISIFCATPPTMYGPFGDDEKYFALDGGLKCQPCHCMKKCPLEGKDAEQCLNYPEPEKIINIVNNILQNSKHSV